MGGGLLQLVAYGSDDLLLTGNPQITFYHIVFRRHTNFTMQSIPQTINGYVKPDSKISFNISRDGDLLTNLILRAYGTTEDSFECIDYIDCEIGGQLIDRHYGHWLNIWCDLSQDTDKTKLLNEMRRGIKKINATVTIDHNQPNPPELNNLQINEIINYPNVINLGPQDIVKHHSGKIFFTKSIGEKEKLSQIDTNGSVIHNFSNSLGFNATKITIVNNNIYAIQDDSNYITRVNVNNDGTYISQVTKWISYGNAINNSEYDGLNPSINGGIDTIGYYAGGYTSIASNQNMLIASSTQNKKYITRIYDNSDQHYNITNFTDIMPTIDDIQSFSSGYQDDIVINAKFNGVWDISSFTDYDTPGNSFLLLTERDNHTIRRIDADVNGNFTNSSSVTTVAGNGTSGDIDGIGSNSQINEPMGVDISIDGSYALICCKSNKIKKIDFSNGQVTTLASAVVNPNGISIHPNGNYALIASLNGSIEKIDLTTNSVTNFINTSQNNPYSIKISPNGEFVIFTEALGSISPGIRKVDIDEHGEASGGISTIHAAIGAGSSLWAITIASDNNTVLVSNSNNLYRLYLNSNALTLITNNYDVISGLTITSNGQFAYVSTNSNKLFKIQLTNSTILIPNYYMKQHTSILKNSDGNDDTINTMQLDENNNIYLCFKNSPGVYKVSGGADREDTPTELITGSETLVERGNGIFIHTDGSIYISCSETHKIIKYENGTFTVIAGDGTDNNVNSTNPLQASFSSPRGMCFTEYNDLLICDSQPKFTADYGSLRVMGGNKPFTSNGIANIPQYSYIPLQFWFCRNPGLALPLIALQYNEVKISIKLAKSLNGITQLDAWGDYIFLDKDERRRFSELSHEYLIEQVQYSNNIKLGTNIITNNTPQEVISVTELFFNHPVKEILWSVYQHTENSQGIIKACSSTNEGGNQNIEVNSSYMQFNGEDRMEERTGNYYTKVQRYQRHTGAGVGITRIGVNSTDISSDQVMSKWFPKTNNIHIYSFSLNPDEYQPSGTCNFSRLDNALIHNTFNTASVNGIYNYSINIYAVNYNILRIISGMGGLAYSN